MIVQFAATGQTLEGASRAGDGMGAVLEFTAVGQRPEGARNCV